MATNMEILNASESICNICLKFSEQDCRMKLSKHKWDVLSCFDGVLWKKTWKNWVCNYMYASTLKVKKPLHFQHILYFSEIEQLHKL